MTVIIKNSNGNVECLKVKYLLFRKDDVSINIRYSDDSTETLCLKMIERVYIDGILVYDHISSKFSVDE